MAHYLHDINLDGMLSFQHGSHADYRLHAYAGTAAHYYGHRPSLSLDIFMREDNYFTAGITSRRLAAAHEAFSVDQLSRAASQTSQRCFIYNQRTARQALRHLRRIILSDALGVAPGTSVSRYVRQGRISLPCIAISIGPKQAGSCQPTAIKYRRAAQCIIRDE